MSLAHPYWLIALITLPLLLIAVVVISRGHSKKWALLIAGRLRSTLVRNSNPVARWLSISFLMAATALIICAMARPRGDGGLKAETAMGRNLLLTLDLSRSMRVDDVKPDRLSLAKLVIYELLESVPNDRIGLVGFAGEPYLYAPLTIDHSAVRETVEQMQDDWPTHGGSDLGAAIDLSVEILEKTGHKNNAMILITDGEMHQGDLEEMIKLARAYGVYIITIGVGTEDGGYVPNSDFPNNRMLDREGKPVISRLRADSLRELASKTNGSFALAGSGADIPAMVKSAIAGLEAFEVEGRERRVYIEFYQWLVLPAIVLLIASLVAGTRWRGVSPAGALAILTLTFSLPQLQAQQVEPNSVSNAMERHTQMAEKALLNSNRTRFRLGEATAAYRLENWDRASFAFSQALQCKQDKVRIAAHHGLGNTLFQKGWLRFVDTPYTAEINSMTSMERFKAAVLERLEALREVPAEDGNQPNFSYEDIRSTILDWADAVRHFQSVLDLESEHQGAIQNKEVTIAYLRKLQELLKENEQQTQESMPESSPQPQSGDGQPDPDGEPGEEGDDPNDENQQGNNPQQSQEGEPNGNQGERDPNAKSNPNNPDQDPGKRPEGNTDEPALDMKPGETPEDRARRILKDSADSEKGPLTPGRIEFRKPDKDW